MTTYYAVCDANGPISVRLDSDDEEGAIIEFEIATMRLWIDNARTDAEDDYEIVDASTMSEGAFADALEAHGLVPVRDLDPIHNAHAGTTAHLAGGWYLWADHGGTRAKDQLAGPTEPTCTVEFDSDGEE